jgi:SAM-dependent methyltransferase
MTTPTSVYSASFFDAFALAIPVENTTLEVDSTARLAPPEEFPRLLDIGCGIGRVTAGLAAKGFRVTGIDASVEALRRARRATPGGRFVAVDFRDVGAMKWQFDVVTSYWNSLGFATRHDDEVLLRGLRAILRPGGRLVLDLYHPGWLEAHQLDGVDDPRGARVYRWLEGGRSCHRFEYPDGAVDDIRFHVYTPDEITAMLTSAGYTVDARLVWWAQDQAPSADFARYQVVAALKPVEQ